MPAWDAAMSHGTSRKLQSPSMFSASKGCCASRRKTPAVLSRARRHSLSGLRSGVQGASGGSGKGKLAKALLKSAASSSGRASSSQGP